MSNFNICAIDKPITEAFKADPIDALATLQYAILCASNRIRDLGGEYGEMFGMDLRDASWKLERKIQKTYEEDSKKWREHLRESESKKEENNEGNE